MLIVKGANEASYDVGNLVTLDGVEPSLPFQTFL